MCLGVFTRSSGDKGEEKVDVTSAEAIEEVSENEKVLKWKKESEAEKKSLRERIAEQESERESNRETDMQADMENQENEIDEETYLDEMVDYFLSNWGLFSFLICIKSSLNLCLFILIMSSRHLRSFL